MAKTGIVTVNTSLNLRKAPGGAVIGSLKNGTPVTILDTTNGWHKVKAGQKTGFVSAKFVVIDHGSSKGFRTVGRTVLAPDGTAFARTFRKGVFNTGDTTIREFVSGSRTAFKNMAPSLLRVMEAVSANEGKLEAINTWDNAFLTFGVFQWTAGTGNGKGELPSMLARLKDKAPDAYERLFGQFGLDVVDLQNPASGVPRGRFSLKGKVLRTAADKEKLRSLEWPYRFWLAGKDPAARQAEIEHATDRINVFYRNPGWMIRDRFIGDYVTSEYGVALLLDQHVNRPGHVKSTVTKAVDKIAKELGSDDPKRWGFAEENRLIDLYLEFRAKTNMTDQAVRARRTQDAVASGLASDKRGSFKLPG